MEKTKKIFSAGFIFYFFALIFLPGSLCFAAGGPGGCIADSAWPMVQHDMLHTGRSNAYGFVMAKGVTKFKAPVASGGIASPVIDSDGTVYIGAMDGCIYAVSQQGSPACLYSGINGTVESTPALSCTGILYVGGTDGNLYAISTTGELQWKKQLGGTILSSPVIGKDGMIFVGSNSTNAGAEGLFYCISPEGETVWERATGDIGYASPALDQYGNVYIASLKGILYAFHSDGDLLWSYDAGDAITSSPVVSSKDGAIYVTTSAALLALDYGGQVKFSPYKPKAIIFESENESAIVAPPALDQEGNIYLGGILGDLHCLNAAGEEQWSSMLKDPTWIDPVPTAITSAPILDKAGNVYVFSWNTLYSLQSKDGKGISAFNLSPESTIKNMPLQSSPALGADRTFYVASADGNLHAVGSSEKMFSLGGTITAGEGVEGVRVYIRSTGEEPEEYEAGADAQGQYSARYLYQGKYLVLPFK
ncbi:MAG: PQQ-binding-like beta-propeller repeat protein, partial [Pseudomonadota bacterium]